MVHVLGITIILCVHNVWINSAQEVRISSLLQDQHEPINPLSRLFSELDQTAKSRYRRNGDPSANGAECPKTKPTIKRASRKCSKNDCVVKCSNNYQFANGKTSAKLICNSGSWILEGLKKDDKMACEPICNPPCKEGCKCKSPGSCSCLEDFKTPECVPSKSGQNSTEDMNCGAGEMEHDGNCMPMDQVPCMMDGQQFEPGSEMRKGCAQCKFENGKWSCINEGCGARCEVYGDPHFKTFDGMRFDFMGKCSYYLMRAGSGMDIMSKNGDCPPGFSKEVACTKSVTVRIQDDFMYAEVTLDQGGMVRINGYEASVHQPVVINIGDSIWMGRISDTGVMMVFGDGLQLSWDGFTYAFIDAPPSYHNRTMGMCGNFDSIAENDMMLPSGKMTTSPDELGNEWRVTEICEDKNANNGDNQNPDENMNGCVPHPCDANKDNKQRAMEVCEMLKSDIFEDCKIDPEPYFKDCMFDLCACQGDRATCMCAIFSAFGNECNRQGQPVQWVNEIPECAPMSPVGQLPDPDLLAKRIDEDVDELDETSESSTEPTEENSESNTETSTEPTEPTTDNDMSTPASETPATESSTDEMEKESESPKDEDQTTEMKPTESTEDSSKPMDMTTVAMETSESSSDEMTENPTTVASTDPTSDTPTSEASTETTESAETTEKNMEEECSMENHKEMVKCLPMEPKTCSNLNNYEAKMAENCEKGCACQNDYVLNEDLNECVLPDTCSCEHKGEKYDTGARIKDGCKACICEEGEWFCSERKCKKDNKKDN